MACGLSLVRACGACGAEAQASARFCVSCGQPLAGREGAPAGSSSPYEERRTVTVLFADIVGYTSFAERLDHESVMALTDRCLTRLAAEVERYGGYVDQYIGDNVMAVFGAPVAHEDDAERAIRAAWGMQAAMSELKGSIAAEFGCELALRVGINTGEVLAGRIGDEYTVVGDAVNVAARLQGAAGVGAILVGERTRRSSPGAGTYREVGLLHLKGKATPVSAWEVVQLNPPSRLRMSDAPSTRFVGRRTELSQLLALSDRVARDGASHLVTIVGEAGVGKSRLVQELELRLKRRVPPIHACHGSCLGFGSGAVYWPLTDMLRAECGITPEDSGSRAFAKISERLAATCATDEAAERLLQRVAPLARLLGEAPDDAGQLGEGDPVSARESFFGAARATFQALAQDRVLVLVWEDLHWADEGTLKLIEYLEQWLDAAVLQVCVARDELLERSPDWGTLRRGATSIFLEPLSRTATRRLVDELAGRSAAPADVTDALVERSGGNPLFAEALVETVAEEGGNTLAYLPDTVQGVLATRLDTLQPFERQLLGHASVIGRAFTEPALAPLAAAAGADLASSLASMREKGLIMLVEQPPSQGEREFLFKHALIRDAAYEMLPKAARARKHAEVGEFIARRVSERDEGSTALLAGHFSRAATLAAEVHLAPAEVAELRAKALEHGEAAGDAAASLFANREALAQYQAVSHFVEPGDPALFRIAEKSGDVALRLGLMHVAVEAWERCLAHHRERGEIKQVAAMHRKMAAAHAHGGEPEAAIKQLQRGIRLIGDGPASLELARLYAEAASLYLRIGANMLASYSSERALQVAEELGEPRAAIRVHGILGQVMGRVGDTARARERLERAVELAARDSDAAETALALLAFGSNLEHCEGDYAGARARYLEALRLAERIGDVPSQIEIRSAVAQLAFYRCDWAEMSRASDISAALAEGGGLMAKLCLPNTDRGRLRWRDGDWAASERLFSHAHDVAEQVGWSEVSCNALMGLAVTLRDRGDLKGAESALTRALAVCERAGLAPQAVQAHAALALVRMLAGNSENAELAAQSALSLGASLRDPVDATVMLEARGVVARLPEAVDALARARAGWVRLDRPLDAARCTALIGRRLRDSDRHASAGELSRAAAHFDELGVFHLARESRELALAG